MISRVAVVSDFSLATLGGAETAYREQVKALAGSVEVVAICPPSAELDALGTVPGVTAVGVPVWFRVPGLGLPVTRNDARLRAALGQILDRHPVDVVHLHSEFAIAAAVHEVARERGIPVVQTVHCWLLTDWPIQRLLALGAPVFHRLITGRRQRRGRFAELPGDSAMRAMTVSVAQDAARVIAPSAHIGAALEAAGLGPVDVIPNVVSDLPEATVVERVDGPLHVLWFGRCVAEKRLLPFVRSVCAVLDQVGPGRLRVDIAGDGEHLARARALAAGRPEIVFHGRVPHEQVAELLRECHVTTLTSVGFDNQPMMIVESVTALRGVLVADPALREGLDGGAGLAAYGDEAAYAAALRALVEDPEPVLAASRAAVDARHEFTAETFVARALESYRKAGERSLNSGVAGGPARTRSEHNGSVSAKGNLL